MEIFVTGATGFIGSATVKALQARYPEARLLCLARSERSEQRVRELGGEPVSGDLSVPGPWQHILSTSNLVVHMAQPQAWGSRATSSFGRRYEQDRLRQDRHLLESIGEGQRVIYVSGSSYFGQTPLGGLGDETMEPQSCGFGVYLHGTIEQVRQKMNAGADIVIAYPSGVYGNGSWFEQFVRKPMEMGSPLITPFGIEQWFSPIHVDDCARAITHLTDVSVELLEEHGREVLLNDDEPTTMINFRRHFSELNGRRMRILPFPKWLLGLLVGSITADYMASRSCFSNARLKALGFELNYPTYREGLETLVDTAA